MGRVWNGWKGIEKIRNMRGELYNSATELFYRDSLFASRLTITIKLNFTITE